MEDRFVLTGAGEVKMRAVIAGIQKQHQQDENNYDYLLGHLKYKRPCLILPKTSGAGCPLRKKRQSLQPRMGFYQLTAYDSDDESTTREHDYCNPRHFAGFTRSEINDSIHRYFLSRDSEFLVAAELSLPEDEPKKPLHIKLELSESELIRTYAHETHYGFLLDPDFRVDDDEVSSASVEELGSEEFDEELLNALLTESDSSDVMLSDSDIHDSMLEEVHDISLRKLNGRNKGVERSLGDGRDLDLLPGDDHSVHRNKVLDSNRTELFQLNENTVSDQSIFMNDENDNGLHQHSSSSLQNFESDGNFHCERDDFSRSSAPQNICVNDGGGGDGKGDEKEVAQCKVSEIEEEEESVINYGIVDAGDSEGEFVGDSLVIRRHRRDPDSESRISDLSLPNYPDSGSDTSLSRQSSSRGWGSDITSTGTSGISLLDIDSNVDPDLGEVYGHYAGIKTNTIWTYRVDLARSGCHRPLRNYIHIGPTGAYSLLLQDALVAKDYGDSVVVYGEPAYKSTARKPKTRRRRTTFNKRRKKSQKKCDQTMTGGNLALYYSMVLESPIRVVRSHTMKSAFSPSTGYRYEGLFYVYSIYIVKTYEQIREFRFNLISDPSLFASREAPRLWQLEGKLPPPTSTLMNFGHPRDTVVGKGCRELVQETSPLLPVETVSPRLMKDTKRRASKRVVSDSKREERLRRTRSLSSESGVETRSGRRSRLLEEYLVSGKSERMVETSMLASTEKLVSKQQQRKSVNTTIESEIHHAMPATVVPAESVKIYPRKRARTTTETVVQSSQLLTENKLMDRRKAERLVPCVKLIRLECEGFTVAGPSKTGAKGRTRSHNGSHGEKALWLEKVENWKADLSENPETY